jgi:hypothetical protein
MGNISKILALLARTVGDQDGGPERITELVGLITEYRSNPPAEGEAKGSGPEWEASKAVSAAVAGDDMRARGEFLLHDCLAELWERLDDPEAAAEKLAEDLLAIVQKKQGAHILWLDVPGGPCFCHVSWVWIDNKRQTALRIRDYLHKKLYYSVTVHTDSEGGRWKLERWDKGGAYQLWYAAKRRVRCRAALAMGVEEFDRWRSTLDELTRTLAPGLK